MIYAPARSRETYPPIYFDIARCTLGHVLVAASQRGITAVFLGDDPQALQQELQDRFPGGMRAAGPADMGHAVQPVVELVEHPERRLQRPLDIRGTAFQRCVWHALQTIPWGHTTSYAALAKGLGRPSSVRAVANACGANPLAVVIPCHRVVRTDGSLAGYRWGVDRKRQLLEREQRASSRGYTPR